MKIGVVKYASQKSVPGICIFERQKTLEVLEINLGGIMIITI